MFEPQAENCFKIYNNHQTNTASLEDKTTTVIRDVSEADLVTFSSGSKTSSAVALSKAGSPRSESSMSSLQTQEHHFPSSSESRIVGCNCIQPFCHEVGISASFLRCDTQSSIFFRTPEQLSNYQKMRDEMKQYFKDSTPQTKPLLCVDVGSIGAVKLNSDWLRAEVVSLKAFPEYITVFLIDEGLRGKVQDIKIYPLPRKFLEIPRTIFRISLHGVHPSRLRELDNKASKL